MLRSSGADHAYRRNVAASVTGKKVVNFLIFDEEFPRSVNYCLKAISQGCKKLPRGRKVMNAAKELAIVKQSKHAFADLDEGLSSYLNELQVKIGKLHRIFAETWFSLD